MHGKPRVEKLSWSRIWLIIVICSRAGWNCWAGAADEDGRRGAECHARGDGYGFAAERVECDSELAIT